MKTLKNIFLTIFFIFATQYLMVLIHTLLHTIIAWAFGFMHNPFDINYVQLAIFLTDKQESLTDMLKSGHNILAAFTAMFPNLINALLFILCYLLTSKEKIQNKIFLYYFLYWFMFMNFGQVYSYIFRSFELTDDVNIFSEGLNISIYWTFIPGMLFIIFGIFSILSKKVPQAYLTLKLVSIKQQAIFLFVSLAVLFGYYGGFVYNMMQKKYYFIIYPVSLTIIFFLICYPANKWVQHKLHSKP